MKQEIKDRLYNLKKSQAYLSRILHRRPQQISQALNGTQPTLLNKILTHLDKLEAKK